MLLDVKVSSIFTVFMTRTSLLAINHVNEKVEWGGSHGAHGQKFRLPQGKKEDVMDGIRKICFAEATKDHTQQEIAAASYDLQAMKIHFSKHLFSVSS